MAESWDWRQSYAEYSDTPEVQDPEVAPAPLETPLSSAQTPGHELSIAAVACGALALAFFLGIALRLWG